MLTSYSWLKRYLPELEISNEEFKSSLTQKTGEVEKFVVKRLGLTNIVCGEILQIEKHPKSDSLNIATVDVIKGKNLESENRKIVCGAPNIKVGQKVAVCLPGGSVFSAEGNGKIIKIDDREVLGVRSQGMICSERELGIGEDHSGIFSLPQDTIVGIDLLENGLNVDTIFEIENKSISHRGDLFSHIGIARELYAILDLKEFRSTEHQHNLVHDANNELPLNIKITTDKCSRFTGVVVSGVTVKDSPLWLQVKLKDLGIRPINNIVDITNYIMLDLGQPMHAYDYDKINGNTLIAREASVGEKVTTLDGVERDLDKSVVVISDSQKVNGIGGIMGGLESSITDKTTRIILEAANFERFNIRKSSRLLNLRTDASARFEKGFDPESTLTAISYAMSLVLDIAGGEIASEIVDVYPNSTQEKIIEFDLNKVQRVLGIQVSRDEVIKMLNKLQIDTSHAAFVKVDGINPVVNTSYVNVIIPSFRMDLNIQEDLLEEVARMYGYANISPSLPLRSLQPKSLSKIGKLQRFTKHTLGKYTYSEMMSYSFVSNELWKICNLDSDQMLRIVNPLMSELEYMRNDLVPSLLKMLKMHLENYGENEYKFFELNRVVKLNLDENGIHDQPWTLGIVKYSNNKKNYISILQIIDEILTKSGIQYKVKNFTEVDDKENIRNLNLYHPSQSGIAYIETSKEIIALAKFGKLNNRVKDNFGFNKDRDIEIASVNLNLISQYIDNKTNYLPISDLEIEFSDFSFEVPKNYEANRLRESLLKVNEIIRVEFIDKYQNNEINSITVRVHSTKNNSKNVIERVSEIANKDSTIKIR